MSAWDDWVADAREIYAPVRSIQRVELTRDAADEAYGHMRAQGLAPHIYDRVVRAENLTVTVWVVVAEARR